MAPTFFFIISVSVAFVVSWVYIIGPARPNTIPGTRNNVAVHLTKDYSTGAVEEQAKLNIQDVDSNTMLPGPVVRTRPMTVYKPRSVETFMQTRFSSFDAPVEWDKVSVAGPDIEDRHTLQQLAMMSGNAYALPGKSNWYDLDEAWNQSLPFGWEDISDGFRGHVFVSSDNDTIILSIKGTTLNGPTSKKDKFNDNLLFSCCCARADFTWMFATVCDCFSKHWRCDSSCLSKALIEESLFYSVGVNLYNNLTSLYPGANIWLTGHSLGGALAALLGSTFGVPAVAFESPGERLAASRLHLPLPPISPITHIYHNADPIPQGTCTGIGSVCAQSGYALETSCHLGKKIVYDTMEAYGWHSFDVTKHSIKEVVTIVLADEREWEPGRRVPLAVEEDEDCMASECYKWEFGDFKKPQNLDSITET